MTLIAVAAKRPAAVRRVAAGRAAIDRYLMPAGPTAAIPPYAAAADRRDEEKRVREENEENTGKAIERRTGEGEKHKRKGTERER